MNIIDANNRIGREAFFSNSEVVHKNQYTDARPIRVPSFIEYLAKSPYSLQGVSGDLPDINNVTRSDLTIVLDLDGDMLSLSEKNDLQSGSLQDIKLAGGYHDLCANLEAHFDNDFTTYCAGSGVVVQDQKIHNAMATLWLGHSVANKKELAKRQVLVGSPTWHHGCSDGDHFNMKDDLEESRHKDLLYVGGLLGDRVLAMHGKISRATEYTLPLTSSQGVILKSRRDSPQFRAISKALQGRYAQLCENEDQLYELVDALKEVCSEFGYDGFVDCFFLGKRKQHTNKVELVDDGNEVMDATYGMQGRVRGIFPPPELFKVYYKPFSDGLKKYLFGTTYLCNVDPTIIETKQRRAISNYITNLLSASDQSGTAHGFYDLSAYDRNTGSSLGSAYQCFLNKVFDSFETKEGRNFTDFKLMFPSDCSNGASILMQDIKYRSTLSGQPDVTVKNNICHMVLLAIALYNISSSSSSGEDFSSSSDLDNQLLSDIIDFLLGGKKSVPSMPGLVVAIHGDDAFVSWIGMKASDMSILHKTFAFYGVPCSDEESLIYLKRTFNFRRMVTNISKREKEILSLSSRPNDLSSFLMKSVVVGDDIITNITGSVVRNRFGEYAVTEPLIGVISYCDTMAKLDDDGMNMCSKYWHDMTNYYIRINEFLKDSKQNNITFKQHEAFTTRIAAGDSSIREEGTVSTNKDFEQIVIRTEIDSIAKETAALMRDGSSSDSQSFSKRRIDLVSQRNKMSTLLNKLLKEKSDLANNLRGFLSRLYYASFEQFDDDELTDLYGNLFYDQSDISDDEGLAGRSRVEIMSMILELQRQLFSNNGEYTLGEDLSSIGKKMLEKMT